MIKGTVAAPGPTAATTLLMSKFGLNKKSGIGISIKELLIFAGFLMILLPGNCSFLIHRAFVSKIIWSDNWKQEEGNYSELQSKGRYEPPLPPQYAFSIVLSRLWTRDFG
jgi:hypothetical protein